MLILIFDVLSLAIEGSAVAAGSFVQFCYFLLQNMTYFLLTLLFKFMIFVFKLLVVEGKGLIGLAESDYLYF